MLLNHRTNVLAELDAATRTRQSHEDALGKARKRQSEGAPDVRRAAQDADRSRTVVVALQERFAACQAAIEREFAAAEAERARDLARAIDALGRIELDAEQTVMAVLTDLERRPPR